jgi:hypothetical protein
MFSFLAEVMSSCDLTLTELPIERVHIF